MMVIVVMMIRVDGDNDNGGGGGCSYSSSSSATLPSIAARAANSAEAKNTSAPLPYRFRKYTERLTQFSCKSPSTTHIYIYTSY